MADRQELNRNLAQMLKGGVIMDVTTPEQAKIAEQAGACAVMALERIPADIRAAGGVSRMSDPGMIKGIQDAVSIPVMAKCRIGHIAEARILEAIEIDYIDEYLGEAVLPRTVSIATGEAAHTLIKAMAMKLEVKIDGLKVNVYAIRNEFFGDSITVAGLLTGKDIAEQLDGRELGDLLLFPENALRADGDLFLDDMSPEELSGRLGVRVRAGHNDGAEFIRDVLGI